MMGVMDRFCKIFTDSEKRHKLRNYFYLAGLELFIYRLIYLNVYYSVVGTACEVFRTYDLVGKIVLVSLESVILCNFRSLGHF